MSRYRTAVRIPLALLGIVVAAQLAPAQVKYPAPPEMVDVQIRYRIRADRDERVRQFRAIEANLKKLGFEKKRFPDDDLDIQDPNAERFEGKIPAKTVFAILDDPRVRQILFKPTTLQLPDTPEKTVPIRAWIPAGFLAPDQQRLHRQVVDQLNRLGLREAVSYDHRGYTLIRGDIPNGNLFRLMRDLRNEPAGWFLADTPADQLTPPIRDTLPIRVVEVLADADINLLNPQPVPSNRARFTPELRAILDNDATRTKPARVEVVYDFRPDVTFLDTLGARLRVTYLAGGGPGGPAFATLEGVAGNIVSIRFPVASDVERFVFEPGIVNIRLARAGGETVVPVTATTPAADALTAARLDALHKLGYRGQGTRIVVIGTEFPGLGQWLNFRFLDKTLTTPVSFIDLTTELAPELLAAPPSGRPAAGIATARAAHLAAPGAKLVLVRVDPAAFFQLLTIGRYVRGDLNYSESLQSRIAELAVRADELRRRNTIAVEEYRQAFQNQSDDDRPRLRRERAKATLEEIIDEERKLAVVVNRFTQLRQSLEAITGTQVVINTLTWESGFPLDGLSELSQVIDSSFAGEATTAPLTRSATRPRVPTRPLWVQPASMMDGSVWSGPYLDADGNGAMEFASPRLPIPAGGWTRELNFLGTRGVDGMTAPTLPAGARVRLIVQWRETHDPTVYGGRDSIFPLTLRVFQQLDPAGEKRASDELQEIARTAGGPYRVTAEPGYGVYEQIVEFTVPADGRYCVRLDGQAIFDSRLPAIRQHIEVTPRLVVDFVGSGVEKGRPVFTSFAPRDVGVGIPADAKAAVTVGAGKGGLIGGGPGIALLAKPDLVEAGPIDTGTGLGGSGVATGFVGGAAVVLIGSGAAPGDLFRATGLLRGGPFVIPEGWLQAVPRRP